MSTRKHIHEEIFDAEPETVFALLHTPSAIRQWWGASHVIVNPKPGGVGSVFGAKKTRPISSPPHNIGTPCEKINVKSRLRCCLSRSD